MNGMHHHHDLYREVAQRRNDDVEAWVRSRSLANIARGKAVRSARSRGADHPRAVRLVGVTGPVVTLLGAIAILI